MTKTYLQCDRNNSMNNLELISSDKNIPKNSECTCECSDTHLNNNMIIILFSEKKKHFELSKVCKSQKSYYIS